MTKTAWLLSCGLVALAAPAMAQDAPPTLSDAAQPGAPTPGADGAAGATGRSGAVQGRATADAAAQDGKAGEIIVTATRRASPLSDVPIAVTAITSAALQNSGATDIRQLNQIAPSLYVSSTSSEAGGGGARIRGIGTVGDNAGLESSVATFIDGVYRSRSGVGLTELGPVERIEVLRGPQGTLFGRNASAGLINVVTARPRFEDEGYAEASYGNYDHYRLGAGLTGPIGTKIAYRVDGIYTRRDGFLKDVISGRRVNDRDRWLVRGKLLLEPSEGLSVLLIGDYAKRDEECCAAAFLPARDVTRAADGTLVFSPSSVAALERGLTSAVPGNGNGVVDDDTFRRRTALTPGRTFRSDVKDRGGSGEVNWDLGGVSLTSITAYRDYKYTKGQDGDFTNLDLLVRASDGSGYTRFRTFSQEVRAQGSLFDDRLDWLVGGYFAHEKLALNDNLSYGADYDRFVAARGGQVLSAGNPALGAAFRQLGFPGLNTFAQAFVDAQLPVATPAATRAALIDAVAGQVQGVTLSNTGAADRFRQASRNFALFTHNIFDVTDTLSVTLGARYTNERKTLDADLQSDTQCGAYAANITRLRALAANTAADATARALAGALANQVLAPLAGLPCVVNGVNGSFSDRRKESEWSGTAVVGWKPVPALLTYASYSRGYKAGGFNLDRAPLFNSATLTQQPFGSLQFGPEKVDAFEVGAKYNRRGFSLNVAAFYQMFKSFQLNTFSGTNFFVTDIRGCKTDLGDTDADAIAGNSQCDDPRSGVTSRGIEVEAAINPLRDVNVSLGYTLASSKFRKDLAGTPDPMTGNNSLQPVLFLLPGARLSNSSLHTVTGSGAWTPPINAMLKGLLYADFRYQSAFHTSSDLFPEKDQKGVMVVNARIGVGEAKGDWSLELWAQNLFDADYKQVGFNAPIQGSGTLAQTQAFGTPATQLFGAFLADPRTYGVTVRTKF